jgi:hypothetical protein
MGTTLNLATLIPGRSFEIDDTGAMSGCVRKYQVLRDFASPLNAENIATVTGLPAIGSAHPNQAGLKASSYRLAEDGSGLRWVVDVVYTKPAAEAAKDRDSAWTRVNRTGNAEISRGWTMQEIQVDLVADAITGAAVLNAAGDPFESVPQVPRSLPVFRLERKESTAISGQIAKSGKYNSAATTIDGVAVPKHAGRLTITVDKLYGDPDGYTYKYTYEVALMEHIVNLAGTLTDIGWDKALVQSGLFYKETGTGTKLRAMEIDEETAAARPRATPVLLDTNGYILIPGPSTPPLILVIATMKEVSFSGMFT